MCHASGILQHGDKPAAPAGPERKHICRDFQEMAGATGLEPATSGVTGRHSNQLSYAPAGVVRALERRAGRS